MQLIVVAVLIAYNAVAGAAEVLRASEVLDTTVETPDGRALGKVKDLVVDLDRGLMRAVVVVEGDELRGHSVAALSRPADTGKLVLRQAAHPVERMAMSGDARLARASELIGGPIIDLVFEPETGRVEAILHSQGTYAERRVPLAELN